MHREHERRGLGREYLAEQRRAADDPRPDPEGKEKVEEETACPFGWAWCDPSADLTTAGQIPCFGCYLNRDRDDGGPHPDMDPETGDPGRRGGNRRLSTPDHRILYFKLGVTGYNW